MFYRLLHSSQCINRACSQNIPWSKGQIYPGAIRLLSKPGLPTTLQLFDQKYIIFSGLAGFVWGQEIGEVIAPTWFSPFLAVLLVSQDESYPNYKWKYLPTTTTPLKAAFLASQEAAILLCYHRETIKWLYKIWRWKSASVVEFCLKLAICCFLLFAKAIAGKLNLVWSSY